LHFSLKMVSALWKACADGDLQRTNELLADATALDVELKGLTFPSL
jgi:hypothetical protein